MSQNLYLPVVLLLTSLCARSQDTLQTRISQDSSIRATLVAGYKYPSLVYTSNGEVLSHREVVGRLSLYAEPAEELQKYRDARTGRFVWAGVSLLAVVGAAVEKSQNNSGAAYTFGGIFLTAMIAEAITAIGAERHLKQAIHIYNKRFQP